MRALALIALLAACETKSDKYCQSHQDDLTNCGVSMMPDAPSVDAPVCTTDDDCTGATPHCLDMTACVGCRDTSDCGEQVCDTTGHTCRACATDGECPSQLCLPSGACAAPADVAFVGGTNHANTICTFAAPCASLGDAVSLPNYPRYIRVLSDVTETNTIQLGGTHTLEIFGGTNKLQLDLGGVGLEVKDQVALTLRNLQVSHTNGSPSQNDDCIFVSSTGAQVSVENGRFTACGGDAIDALDGKVAIAGTVFDGDDIGVEAFNDAELTISRALFRATNRAAIHGQTSKLITVDDTIVSGCATGIGGGHPAIDIGGAIAMTNSIVVGNGDSTALGAIRIGSAGVASKLDFVTIANNFTAGASCTIPLSVSLTNAIVTGNTAASTCKPSYSLGDAPDATHHVTAGDPKFLVTDDPTSAMFYRIGSTSSAIGIGMADAVTVDIDGQARTSTPDVGADEYVP